MKPVKMNTQLSVWLRLVVNLAKRRCCGSIFGKRATVDVCNWATADVTMCATISDDGQQLQKVVIGQYNKSHLIVFLD